MINVKELLIESRQLTSVQIRAAIEILNTELEQRTKAREIVESMRALAKDQGYTLEQLGLVCIAESNAVQDEGGAGIRPKKPKLHTIRPDSMWFYVENKQVKLLRSHTIKRNLAARGLEVVPLFKLDPQYTAAADSLIDEARKGAVARYNEKARAWNEWAAANGESQVNLVT